MPIFEKNDEMSFIIYSAHCLQFLPFSFQLRVQHDEELAVIERELTFLQANMFKEQKRLESIIAEKMAALAEQETEVERLRKQNKKLLNNSKLLAAMVDQDRDMDTPSSEDSSPKSSFSNKAAKIEIKPRLQHQQQVDLESPPTKDDFPTLATSATTSSTSILPKPVLSGLPKRPPPPPPSSDHFPNPTSPISQKPPVPSRAGIDRKLQKSGFPPPAPPVRSVSLLNGSVTPTKDDSGRDSDATETDFHHHEQRHVKTSLASPSDGVAGDEGFCSSHEDHHNNNNNNVSRNVYDSYLESIGLNTKSVVSPSRQLTNHRAVQKPSDIKFRAKLKSTVVSNLAVLEEHPVTGDGQVTTVTYWTEPYL